MRHTDEFFIDGRWVRPDSDARSDVVNPATEQTIATVSLGNEVDVDVAVAAARAAFPAFSATSVADRMTLLADVVEAYRTREADLAEAVSLEMGAPVTLATTAHVPAGRGHFVATREALGSFDFEEHLGTTTLVYEPIGVCAFITPWNWPLNQISAKVAPALAAGCTMVLKPSEIAPLSAIVFAEVLAEAGVPAGVFNLVQGDGMTVGRTLSAHPDVDMVSFTGSTRAGVEVARNAAPTVKRVAQELGGNSANIILDDADLEVAVARDIERLYANSGQSCNASSRILVPAGQMDRASEVARATTERIAAGMSQDGGTTVGPVASAAQFAKVQALLEKGVAEGATLVVGGPGRPPGIDTGFYVRPTVFSYVTNDMAIAREEIFGPVATLIGYEDDDDAVRIANDTDYGLSAMVSSANLDRARSVARRIRAGMVHLNGAPLDRSAPFGGYKQSGNGREFGSHGLQEFLEVKSIYGHNG